MHCKRCGSKLEENTLGCPVCGQPIDEDIYDDFEKDNDFEFNEREEQVPEKKEWDGNHRSQIKFKETDISEQENQRNSPEKNLDIADHIPEIGNEKQTTKANGTSKNSNIASRIPEIKNAEQIEAEQAKLEQTETEQAWIDQTQELYLQAATMQVGNIDQTQRILRINDPRQQTLLGAHRGLFFTFIALVLIAILAVSAALYIYKDNVEQESVPYYTITYETNGGSRIPSQEVKEGTIVSAPPEPTISGRYFAGWYSDTSCQKQIKFPLTANENITLYAKWVRDQKAAEQALNNGTSDNTN